MTRRQKINAAACRLIRVLDTGEAGIDVSHVARVAAADRADTAIREAVWVARTLSRLARANSPIGWKIEQLSYEAVDELGKAVERADEAASLL